MKLGYLVNQYPKASHSFIRREIAALEEQGFQIERWSIRRVDEPLVDEADRAEALRTRVILDAGAAGLAWALARTAIARPLRTLHALRSTLALSRAARGGLVRHLAYLAEACVLLPELRRAGCAHLHAHFGTNPAAVAMLLHELGGPPFSFTAHGTESFDDPRAIGLGRKLARARFAVAVCESGRAELAKLCDPSVAERIAIVRCGVDRAFLDEPERALPAAPRLVCVGRLSPEKGQRVLIEAAARLAAEGTDFELALIGDGELRPELEALVRERGLAPRVQFLGWKSNAEVRAELAAARALVLPSHAEGLPVVLMESLALRRPVVASAVGGIPELVEPGLCGWLVPPGRPEELAAALRALLASSPERLLAMGRAGRERVTRLHDARAEAARLAERFRAGDLGARA